MPLVIEEASSALAKRWLDDDNHVITWVWTRVEIVSAVERRVRHGLLSPEQRRSVLDHVERLASQWDEITEVLAVRSRANALLARHPLRAADAGQLGAALHAQGSAERLTFVSLDQDLALAAEREGLRVLDAGD